MGPQVTAVFPYCFYQLRQLRVVRRSLTEDALRLLVQAFIHCRLDYCNALLAGIADTHVKRLQSVQNAAARLVSGARRRDHITPVLRSLHWLPVRRRIFLKTAVLVRKCIICHSRLSTGSMLASGECPRSSSSTVCIDWMCGAVKSVYVNRPASTVPQSGTACRLLCATSLSLNTFSWQLKAYLLGQ